MRKIFLITLALVILSSLNLFDKNFFGAENFADAQRARWQGEVPVTENFAEEVLQLVNLERAKVGAKPLTLSPQLMKYAAVRAEEITEKFSHTRPDGTSCFTVVKISYRRVGENIAEGQNSPEKVVEAWMNSEGHRANILNPEFGKLGVGYFYAQNTDYKHYWVQLFKD